LNPSLAELSRASSRPNFLLAQNQPRPNSLFLFPVLT
jgi:hypothetical protein